MYNTSKPIETKIFDKSEEITSHGSSHMSTDDLLAMIINKDNGHEIANNIMACFSNLRELYQADVFELTRVDGVSLEIASRIHAGIALGARSITETSDEKIITSNNDAAALLQERLALLDQETLWTATLNSRNKLISLHQIYKGCVNSCTARISEILRPAIARNSPAVIVYHNHPSGDSNPSPEDIHLTREIVSAAKLFTIDVLDHIIIGGSGHSSIKQLLPDTFM